LTTNDQVEVEGLRIAYRREGRGRPLLLLHGFFGDTRVWRRQFDDLSPDFDLIAWDAPGAGRSDDPPEAWRMPEYARCLGRFIEAIGVDRPNVLGLSFGSTLALELYRQRPDLPAALVLASAYAGWTGSLSPEMVRQRLQQTIADFDLPAEQVVAIYNVPGLLTENAPPELVDENAAIMRGFHPGGMKVITRSLAEADLRDMLQRIEAQTLLIYGDRDVRSPLSIAHDLHARIPGSKLAVLPGVGHLCNVEGADLFNAEVRAFLRNR